MKLFGVNIEQVNFGNVFACGGNVHEFLDIIGVWILHTSVVVADSSWTWHSTYFFSYEITFQVDLRERSLHRRDVEPYHTSMPKLIQRVCSSTKHTKEKAGF